MREQSVGRHLDRLADPEVAVRGAAAALQAAQAAALIERAAAMSVGDADAGDQMEAARTEASRMRERALRVGDADDAVGVSGRVVWVPLRTAALAADLVRLAVHVRDTGDDEALPLIAVAAVCAKAALESSAVYARMLAVGAPADVVADAEARLRKALAAVPVAEDLVGSLGEPSRLLSA